MLPRNTAELSRHCLNEVARSLRARGEDSTAEKLEQTAKALEGDTIHIVDGHA